MIHSSGSVRTNHKGNVMTRASKIILPENTELHTLLGRKVYDQSGRVGIITTVYPNMRWPIVAAYSAIDRHGAALYTFEELYTTDGYLRYDSDNHFITLEDDEPQPVVSNSTDNKLVELNDTVMQIMHDFQVTRYQAIKIILGK
jgi:hypothetical protein